MKHTLLYIIGLFVWLCNMHAQSSVDTKIAVNSQNDDKTFVVIISNENYKHEEPVPFAKNDGEVFKVYCQKTLGIPESNIRYIPDATLNEMNFEIDWLGDVLNAYEGDARGIIYYTGHGMPDENSKEAYLLPVDGYSKSPSSGMSTKSLYDKLKNMHSNSIMVFLDACFSGAKRDGKMLASSRGVAIRVRQDPVGDNTVVFSAAQGDETAYPYKSQQHGMFTYFILDKLQQSGGYTTLGELSSYVTTQVKRKSVVVNGKSQTPSIISSPNNKNWGEWWLSTTVAKKFERRLENNRSDKNHKDAIQETEYIPSMQEVSYQAMNYGNDGTKAENGLTKNYNPLSEDPNNVVLIEMGKKEVKKRKYTSANKHFLEAASQGSVEANYQLGLLYENLDFKNSNINVAMSFFSKAADVGHIKSMYELGVLYVGTWETLYGQQKDTIQAVKWFYEAANLGHVESMYKLGLIYTNSNKELAREWLQKAANLGDVWSMYSLGCSYINSDNELSQEWFRKAANKGHKYAQEELKNFVNGYYNPPPKPTDDGWYSGF